jgi:hypothetical protein
MTRNPSSPAQKYRRVAIRAGIVSGLCFILYAVSIRLVSEFHPEYLQPGVGNSLGWLAFIWGSLTLIAVASAVVCLAAAILSFFKPRTTKV